MDDGGRRALRCIPCLALDLQWGIGSKGMLLSAIQYFCNLTSSTVRQECHMSSLKVDGYGKL